MRNERDEAQALSPGSEEPTPPAPIDAAESRWDPWLLALAKLEAESEARPN